MYVFVLRCLASLFAGCLIGIGMDLYAGGAKRGRWVVAAGIAILVIVASVR